MSEGEVSHDLAGMCPEVVFVLAIAQSELHSGPDFRRICKDDGSLADCEVGRGDEAILPRLWIDRVEKHAVRLQDVGIGKLSGFFDRR